MLVDRLVLAHDSLQEDFTTKKLAIRAELPNGDISSPILYISTGGAVTVYRWLARGLSERGIPEQVVQQFLDGLHGIDPKFPGQIAPNGQIQGFKGVEKNASLANVLPRFSELEQLLAQLLQDIDRHAQQAV